MKTANRLSALTAVVALFSPPSFADNADFRFSIGDVSVGVGIGTPPPAPLVEYVPVAVPGHVWVPGYWAWNGHRYVWSRGVWEMARPGYTHRAGHWEQRGNHWHFQPSRWETHRIGEHRSARQEYVKHAWYEGRHDRGSWHDHDARRVYSR